MIQRSEIASFIVNQNKNHTLFHLSLALIIHYIYFFIAGHVMGKRRDKKCFLL